MKLQTSNRQASLLASNNSRAAAPDFGNRLARIENILLHSVIEGLAEEISGLVERERSYLPAHKKGGAISYDTLRRRAPKTVALYLSADLGELISDIIGERVRPTPVADQSSCSILFYDLPGDHIGWHYDHNFYRGRHITVLLPIINKGHGADGLSSARLEARIGEDVRLLSTPPNTLIVFEGQNILHRVTPIAKGERRVILSMCFVTDTSASMMQGIKRRIKDTAFFGVRALWT